MPLRLESENGFEGSEIRTLVDKPSESNGSNEIGQASVTREQILTNLRWLLTGDSVSKSARNGPPSQLFFHFSGHGDGKQLLPSVKGVSIVSGDGISDSELAGLINDLLPANATLTCIFDCCDGTKMLESLLRYPMAFGTTQNLY